MRLSLLFSALLLLACNISSALPDIPSEKAKKYAQKPLAFIQNKGQIVDQHGKQRKDIDYKLETPTMNIFIGNGEVHYQWNKADGADHNYSEHDANKKNVNLTSYRLDVTLIGANTNAVISEEDIQAPCFNYYLPQCSEGATAHTYSRITYHNIYPNIDWVLYTNKEGLKYDFVVHPGGNAANIRIRYDGATALALKQGALTATTLMGAITEQAPYSYDAVTGKTIPSSFKLNDNILSFTVANSENGMVIDPALKWATYYGGSSVDYLTGLTCDTAGNVIVTGFTGSFSNIATTGAHQTTYNLGWDAYYAKFSPAGSLLWGTYYGGSGTDRGADVATNLNGDIYATGYTYSTTDIATAGAHQTTANPSSISSFIAKFNSAGVRQWATYYADYPGKIACDNLGNVFVAGHNSSGSGVTTTGAHKTTYPSNGIAGYIAKFNSAGVRQWGTFYYYPQSIACDAAGNVIVTGYTWGSDGDIGTTGAHQLSRAGAEDGFIAKFNTNGTMLWSTWVGGTDYERVYSVSVDPYDNIYVGGITRSTTGIATSGTFQTIRSSQSTTVPQYDGFVNKFSSSGTRLWGSYIAQETYVHSVSAGPDNKLYVMGQIGSGGNTFTTTSGAHQSSFAGDTSDLFFTVFDASGGRLYSTYYGGPDEDALHGIETDFEAGIAVSKNGRIYFGGTTESSSGLTTSGSYDESYNTNWDAFLVQFEADRTVFIDQPTSYTKYCKGDSIKVHYGVTQSFNSSNTFTLELSGPTGSWTGATTLASTTTTGAGILKAKLPSNLPTGTGYKIRIVASSPAMVSETNGGNIVITPMPTISPVANSPVCTGDTIMLSSPADTITSTYTWTGPKAYSATSRDTFILNTDTSHSGYYVLTATSNGCVQKDSVQVTVSPLDTGLSISITANPGVTVPIGTSVTFTATVSNGGPTPKYVWKLNGTAVSGATTSSWTSNTLIPGDIISAEAESSMPCPAPATAVSNTLQMVSPADIGRVPGNSPIMLFPSPNSGTFTIQGLHKGHVQLSIINTLGQEIHTEMQENNTGTIKVSTTLPGGIYLVLLKTIAGENHTLRFCVTQ